MARRYRSQVAPRLHPRRLPTVPHGDDYEEDWGQPYYPLETIVVYEEDDWIDTGVLDEYGDPIYRTDKVPLGILRWDGE